MYFHLSTTRDLIWTDHEPNAHYVNLADPNLSPSWLTDLYEEYDARALAHAQSAEPVVESVPVPAVETVADSVVEVPSQPDPQSESKATSSKPSKIAK